MGEIPRIWFSRWTVWVVAATLASIVGSASGAVPQTAPTQAAGSSTRQAPLQERKTLALKELPIQTQADILMARGEYAAAIGAYQKADLKSALVWNAIGMAYHHLFALDEARKAYQNSLAINPRFAAAANNLAAVYYAQGNFSQAEHWYKKALKHTSESAVIYCNLGTAYFAQARYKNGIKEYRKAFAIDPKVFAPDESVMVQAGSTREQRIAMNYFVAATYASAGQKEQALVYLRKAMDEGFKDRKRLSEDKDFAGLRTDPDFQHLLIQENLN